MNESTIGIKIANGSYFPILEDDSNKRKRLVLTTVSDNQENVQIDLYRGKGKTLDEAIYIGSLQIDKIEPADKGVPEIELFLGLDDEGNLDAKASDIATGESQSLSLSLDSLDEEQTYDEPDFEIDQSMDTEDVITPEEESKLTSGPPEATIASSYEVPQKKKSPLMIILFVVLGLALIGAAIFLIISLSGKDDTGTDTLEADNTVTTVAESDAESASDAASSSSEQEADSGYVGGIDVNTGESVSAEEAAQRAADTDTAEGTVPAVSITAVSSDASVDATDYLIRRGDTLWEISRRYYGDPYQYPSIATENGISNPDLIFWGFRIKIPGKP